MWASDNSSTRIDCAGSGALTPLFHLTLTDEQRAAGGAVIVGFRLSTPPSASLFNWTGLDLVAYFDRGDSHSRIYPQPDQQRMRQWLPDGVTGRAQIDVPISMLFTVGSPTGRALRPTGSPLTRYYEEQTVDEQRRSVGELLAPMPFWRSVHIYVRNRQQSSVPAVGVSVHGRFDLHYTESLAGHLYAHYFFAQTDSTAHIPADMRLANDSGIEPHWAEQLSRDVERYGVTETAYGLKQQAAAAAVPSAQPSLNHSWCGAYDATFPSYVMLDDDYGHNPFAPRGSFVVSNQDARPGLWQLHSIRGLSGRVAQWNLHYTTNPHFLVESDIRITVDDTLWMSSTGLEDVFFGAHGYAHVPELLHRADFGWFREGEAPGFDSWYNMRMWRNWQGAGPSFGDSIMWGLEPERHFSTQLQSVLLLYGKPTTNTSRWRTELTDVMSIGCDDQLSAHHYRIVQPNASAPTGLALLNARHGEYELVDGQMQYLLMPHGDLWRHVNAHFYNESQTGQLFTQRTQLHFTVALHPQHAQCWLIRRTDGCSAVQAARVFIRGSEWQPGGSSEPVEWAAVTGAGAGTEWLDGGLWYSQLGPCPHVLPEGRVQDVRHPLPFAATRGRSRVTLALDVQPHERSDSVSPTSASPTAAAGGWAVDAVYLSHRMFTNESAANPPSSPDRPPLRSFSHFRYTVQCSLSPFYRSDEPSRAAG